MNVQALVRALVKPALDRVKVLAQRGVVRSSTEKKAQELVVAVLAGETLSRVERLAHFGLVSRVPDGGEVVLLCLGGNRDHPIAVADEDRRVRPTDLAKGEAGLYSVSGSSTIARITLRADGTVEIVAPGAVVVTGDVEASGDVSDGVGALDAFRQIYNVHTHSDPQGGTTGPPNQTA